MRSVCPHLFRGGFACVPKKQPIPKGFCSTEPRGHGSLGEENAQERDAEEQAGERNCDVEEGFF